MRQRLAIAFVAVMVLAGSAAAANDQLIAALKQLGPAVDNMTVNISNAQSDADAQLLVKVTRQAFESQLKDYHPKIDFKASAGYCKVTIETPEWTLWSEARDGKVVDHGATVKK